MTSKRITLKPSAGFVVKTTNEQPGIYTPTVLPQPSAAKSKNSLEPVLQSTVVTKGFKIFINIAYEHDVPPPPRSSENEIRKAMAGDANAFFVPVVISDGREATDKAGKVSLVFDAVFSETLRERMSKDVDFKTFIIEIALERVEEKSGLVLGREIGTPNLKSKGPLDERTVLVPAGWSPASDSPTSTKPLIEEVTPTSTSKPSKPVSTPSPSSTSSVNKTNGKNLLPTTDVPSGSKSSTSLAPPKWTLEIESTGTGPRARSARIEVQLPLLTREDYDSMTLDLERNRLLLDCKPKYALLDVPLLTSAGKAALGLDVDDVKAEWRVKQGLLVISATIVT